MLKLNIFGRFHAADDRGNEIPIKSRKVRALLAYLALPPGKPRSREELMAVLWSDRGDEQARGSLRQALSGLRRDLGDDSAKALRFADDAVSLDPDHVTIVPTAPGEELLEGLHINDPAFDEWLRDERLRLEDEIRAAPQPELSGSSDKPSIVVLPFVNMSGDPEQEYFSDGITADIITELSRFKSHTVIGRNSSFHFKGQSRKVQDIAEELDIQYVVEGSVQRSGERVRVTAQLTDGATGNNLWAERYDRRIVDLFAVQDEVTSTITTMVSGHVDLASQRQSRRNPADNISAYDLVLHAEWLLDRDFTSPEAIRMIEQAIEIDPTYAEAHAGLALNYAYTQFYRGVDIHEVAELSLHHGRVATKLAPGDAEVNARLAEAYTFISQHEMGEYHADKAMSLNPHSFRVMTHVATVRNCLGDRDTGLELIRKILANDPYATLVFRESIFDAHYMSGNYELALDQFTGWPDPPAHVVLSKAAALGQLDRIQEARNEVERASSMVPETWQAEKVVDAYCRMCALPEDKERWLEGFRKAGLEI